MSDAGSKSQSSWLAWWPAYLGGFCGPFVGRLLTRWLPIHFAMGVGFAAVWLVVSLLLSKKHPPKWGLPPWFAAMLAGCAGGLLVGVLYFVFP